MTELSLLFKKNIVKNLLHQLLTETGVPMADCVSTLDAPVPSHAHSWLADQFSCHLTPKFGGPALEPSPAQAWANNDAQTRLPDTGKRNELNEHTTSATSQQPAPSKLAALPKRNYAVATC